MTSSTRRRLPLIIILTLLLTPARAGVIYVASGGPGPDGLSWATAFGTIQAGLTAAAAQPERTCWVKNDTFSENVTVPANVSVYGGFLGTESPLDPNPYGRTGKTTVNPAAVGTPIFSASTGTRVDGFIIQNNTADMGAGVLLAAGATCIINNNEFSGLSSRLGGAIYAGGVTSLSVTDSTFTNCLANDTSGTLAAGGAIYLTDGSLIVNRCAFTNARATVTTTSGNEAKGGAIYAAGGTQLRVERTAFNSCYTGGSTVETRYAQGGACYSSGMNATYRNCLFSACSALGAGAPVTAKGGAIAFMNQGAVTIINNTLVGNEITPQAGSVSDTDRSYGLGSAIYVNGTATANIVNNIITHNLGTAVVNEGMVINFNYNLLWHNSGGDIYGFNFPPQASDFNIMKDPQFWRDPTTMALDPDYHISYGSPAKNAGTNSGAPSTDIDGEPRPWPPGGIVDIGWDEFVDADADGGPDIFDPSPGSIVPPEVDPDGDGIYFPYDNCPLIANPTQADSNGDGVGDACTGVVPVYYVDSSVASSGNGTTWATAFKTIQEGIDAADLHNMAGWTYNPQVWVRGNLTYNEDIQIWHGVRVYGGWAGTEVDWTMNPNIYFTRNVTANKTIIDGTGVGSTVVIAHLPQDRYLSGVLKTNYAALQAVLDGCTVTGGVGELGGGVSIYKEAANVSSCIIENNTAALGGGVYLYKSSGVVGDGIGPPPGNVLTGDTAIDNNDAIGAESYAGYGGGVYIERGSPTLFANIITDNTAYFGGGIASFKSAPLIVENLIGCQAKPNTASGTPGDNNALGGGIYLNDSDAVINKETLVSNIASGTGGLGGGIYAVGSDFWMKNSIVAFNTANLVNGGGAIYGSLSAPIITYSDFWNNTAPQFVGITDPTTLPANHNLAVNPLFVNPAACNYRLQAGSPLNGAGDPLDGSPNMGAFQDEDPPVTLAEAKKLPNGVTVEVENLAVTAVYEDGVYVEDANRTHAIKLITYRSNLKEGDIVNVVGVMTTIQGERMIIKPEISLTSGKRITSPVGLSNVNLGGGPYGDYALGVTGGTGPNNVGLLVSTTGVVKSGLRGIWPSVIIDDGSKVGV